MISKAARRELTRVRAPRPLHQGCQEAFKLVDGPTV
jgi:hypothetical protein